MTTGEVLRALGGLEGVYVEMRSPALIDLVLTGAAIVLRGAAESGADLDELALVLATSGLSVVAASLFDTTDSRLQPLSTRYRHYLCTDVCAVSIPRS